MMASEGITLITSDFRPRYANDALAVLAAPYRSVYQFRYEDRLLPPDVKFAIEDKRLANCSLLVAYREEKAGSADDDRVIVPLRWARLDDVEKVAEFFRFTFVCLEYPVFHGDPPRDRADLVVLTKQYREQYKGKGKWEAPVHMGRTSLVAPSTNAPSHRDAWSCLAKALAQSEPFATTHFLRVGEVVRPSGESVHIRKDGCRELSERESVRLCIDYYAAEHQDGHGAKLVVNGDKEIVRVASGAERTLDCRYDSVTIWLHAGTVSGETRSELDVRTTDNRSQAYHTHVQLPVVVSKSRKRAIAQVILTGLGAMLVAVPGLLPAEAGISLVAKLAVSALGAVVLAAAARIA